MRYLIAALLLSEAVALAYFWASVGWDCRPDCGLDQKVSGYAALWVLPTVILVLLVWSVVRWLTRRQDPPVS